MFRRRSYQEYRGVDTDLCADSDLIDHLKDLLKSDKYEIPDTRICPPDVVQKLFDLAHTFDQPVAVMCHVVGLIEALMEKGANFAKITPPMVVVLASKLHLRHAGVPLTEVQYYLSSRQIGEYSLAQLQVHEQQILATLDFRVESNTMLQLMETILTSMHRSRPFRSFQKYLDIAGYLSCVYLIHRRNMPACLKRTRLRAASALTLISLQLRKPPRTQYSSFRHLLSEVTGVPENIVGEDAATLMDIVDNTERRSTMRGISHRLVIRTAPSARPRYI